MFERQWLKQRFNKDQIKDFYRLYTRISQDTDNIIFYVKHWWYPLVQIGGDKHWGCPLV